MIDGIKAAFEAEPCNTGRQVELDIGKAFPILCLAYVHCIIECSTPEQLTAGIPFLFDSVIGGPLGAPMFLLCMGATVHFTRANSPKDLALRGLKLVFIGFLLNIFRFLVPDLVGYMLTGDEERFITSLPYRVFGNDVLQFAGIAFICLALMRRMKLPAWAMIAISLVFSLAGTELRGTDFNNDALNIAGGWFLGMVNEENMIISDFPILNWLLVPVAGYCFGGVLCRVRDKRRFYLYISPIPLMAAVLAMALEIRGATGMFGEGQNAYYHLRTHDLIICIALNIGLLGAYEAISRMLAQPVKKFFVYTSSNITAYYCIHWVIVRMSVNVIIYSAKGSPLLPIWAAMIVSSGVVLLTFSLLKIYRKLYPRERKSL